MRSTTPARLSTLQSLSGPQCPFADDPLSFFRPGSTDRAAPADVDGGPGWMTLAECSKRNAQPVAAADTKRAKPSRPAATITREGDEIVLRINAKDSGEFLIARATGTAPDLFLGCWLVTEDGDMNRIKEIRERLGLTQQELAEGIGCSQGNVVHLENGQALMPHRAELVIDIAAKRGLSLTMDQVYGREPLPAPHDDHKARAHG